MLNFDYLKQIPELSQLHEYCDMAEQRQLTETVKLRRCLLVVR